MKKILTPKQLSVVFYLSQGHQPGAIAEILGCSSISELLTKIRRNLGLTAKDNHYKLVVTAIEAGYIAKESFLEEADNEDRMANDKFVGV